MLAEELERPLGVEARDEPVALAAFRDEEAWKSAWAWPARPRAVASSSERSASRAGGVPVAAEPDSSASATRSALAATSGTSGAGVLVQLERAREA